MRTLFTALTPAVSSLILGLALCLTPLPLEAQEDNPNLDSQNRYLTQEIPQGTGPAAVTVITDELGFDNFDLGTTNAEPHMSTNPLNPLWFFNAFNTNSAWRTTDGNTWIASAPSFPSVAGDPVTAYDSLGNLYYETMKNPITGCWVVTSTNNGQTWNTAVTSVTGNDKNWIAADQTRGPFANYVYTTMTNSGVGNFARSTDRGLTWSTPISFTPHVLPGMMVAVGPNVLSPIDTSGGCVYVVTHSGSNGAGIYTFFVSRDGGATFVQKSQHQFSNYIGTEVGGRSTVQFMRCRPYPFLAADNSFGPFRGRLYLVYASNNPSGNGNKSDIFLRYSTDQGGTWSSAVVVNDDANSQNNFQFHPAIWCDKETGRLYIKFYDTRRVPTSDSMDVYATYTDDGGATFAPNQRLTTAKFRINITNASTATYRGDYDAITSNRYTSMAVWTDFRNAPSPNYLGMTAYFPDFAMLVSPASTFLGTTDSMDAVAKVPAVKLYTHSVRFSASVSPSANFTFSFPGGDTLTSYPDSLIVRVKTTNVAPGTYTVTITGSGPNGTPVHRRTMQINVVANTNFVSVIQPNGGEQWLTGTSQNIQWARAGGVDTVRLEYSTNAGTTWNVIAARVNAIPGTYAWTVPTTPTTQALVRVTWVDSVQISDQSDAVFSIVGAPVVGVMPDSMVVTLRPDSSTTRTLTISNTGLGPLNFTLSIESTSARGRSSYHPPASGFIGQYADDATPPPPGSLSGESGPVGTTPRSIFDSSPNNLPDLMYYKFEEVGGSRTKNFANPGTAVNDSADVLGNLSMGGIGQFGAALIGTGGASSSNFVNTNWATSLPGSWAVSMWLNNLPGGTTLYYLWGDVNAGSFRCFYTGAAGANNLLVRGPLSEVLITGVGPGPSVVDVIYDSSVPEIRAYVNGVLNRTVPQSSLNISGGGPFKIAGYSTLAGMPPSSLMDEFKMYNRVPSAITWVSLDTLSGTVPAGGSMNVTVTFNSSGLTPDNYTADIVVLSNDPATPEVRRRARLVVTPSTGVGEGGSLPETFLVEQNYPNPFNPVTTLRYGIPEQSHVTLGIYDVLGVRVATLQDGVQSAGFYDVVWQARNDAGAPVASGVYFYRVEATALDGSSTYRSVHKMLLLK